MATEAETQRTGGPQQTALQPLHLRHYVWTLVGCWTAAIAVVLAWRLIDARSDAAVLAHLDSPSNRRDQSQAFSSAVKSVERTEFVQRIAGYGGIWLLGLVEIALLSRRLRRQVAFRYQAERQLREAHDSLEKRVAQRTAELAEANRKLHAEIVERQQAERWLLESEQRFRGYFEQGLVGMAILSPDKKIAEINQRLCRMLGYPEHELIGVDWIELAHPEERPAEEAQLRRLLAGTLNSRVSEKRLLHRRCPAVPAGVSMQCLRKADQSIDCILVLVQLREPPRQSQDSVQAASEFR